MLRPFLLMSLIVAINPFTAASAEQNTLNVADAESTTVTLYRDRALIHQHFNRQLSANLSANSALDINGIPTNGMDGSLNVEFRKDDQVIRPESIVWYQGGLDRDNYYRHQIGKPVDVYGSGLSTPQSGKLLTFDNGVGLVAGNNGRQYFVDYHDSQGLRMIAQEAPENQGQYLNGYRVNFGQQTTRGALTISYVTPSLSYNSHYRLNLNEANDNSGRIKSNRNPVKAQLSLTALLSNASSMNIGKADVRLVAGDSTMSFSPMMMRNVEFVIANDAGNAAERVGEVLLTPLPKKMALPANSRQLVNLSSESLTMEQYYILDNYSQNGSGNRLNAERPTVFWRFKAPVDLTPAPVRIYETDASGAEIIGAQSMMPKATDGETVWLPAGEALAVRVERSGAEMAQQDDKTRMVKWTVTVSNDRKETSTLLLRERNAGLVKLSEVKGAVVENTSQLKFEVPAGSRKTITYVATYQR